MARRAIRLVRADTKNVSNYSVHGVRVRVDVAEVAGDMPSAVFVYHPGPLNPVTGLPTNIFQTIASVADIAEYPENEPRQPSPGDMNPPLFFRLNFVELDFRSITDANNFWELVCQQVDTLRVGLNLADTLQVVESRDIGAFPDGPVSSDSSGSSTSI